MPSAWILLAMAATCAGRLAAAQAGTVPHADSHLVLRVLDDASNGDRWVLEKDAAHPGGPGKLLQIGRGTTVKGSDQALETKRPVMVIHAGDRVVVEEETPVVDARLEAIALTAASSGAELKVRLRVGNRVVRTVALSPGHARLAVEAIR